MEPTEAPGRWLVNAGFVEGKPYVEIADRLANAGVRFGLIEAAHINGMIAAALANILGHLQAESERKQQQHRLVVPR